MNVWVTGCRWIYRNLASAYPYAFRMTCGDGLERLGEDLAPLVWQQQGFLGLVRLTGDVALRLPVEYARTWIAKIKETMTMPQDLFEGTWKANNEKSQWDPNYTPEQACLRFEATESGYILVAYGIKDGKAVAERPQQLLPDGKRHPIVDLNGRPIPGVPPGAVACGSRPDSHTMEGWVELDGKKLGGGTYRISPDGQTMTVTTEGTGMKGPFKLVALFERVVPDPYTPQG